jgi:hypothetical protein
MTEMQKPREEMLKEFLQEVQREVDYVVRPREIFGAIVCMHVEKVIELLVQGKWADAREKLGLACKTLAQAKADAIPEDFNQALYAFDLGFFAYSLESYLYEFEFIVRQIWHERKVFLPHLAEALRGAYLFAAYLRNGSSPRWSFYHALKSLNYMRLILGHYAVNGTCPIGHFLAGAAMTKLKDILRAYARARNSSQDAVSNRQ